MIGNVKVEFVNRRSGRRRDGLACELGFPKESEMELPLLAALATRGGVIWFSRDGEWLEEVLADYFKLGTFAREYSDPDRFTAKGGRAWRNKIQWVRNHLVEKQLIDNQVRDRWALTERGWEVGRGIHQEELLS